MTDVRADALRDLESDRTFLDSTSPFDAPGASYRLNTWVRTRIPALLAELDRVTSQRDQAIELGGDIDLLASASLRVLEAQRNAAQDARDTLLDALKQLHQAADCADNIDEDFYRSIGETIATFDR
ncbi:hypothetical protein [Gordonia rubripertincta]|uniref:hypothetical protein n=1 Tax=Gordonia rubripertincta TaxID=36822 RepID=UPI0015FA503E|nr:hypothetical protein [Gordonia rubripertincta]QMU22487.1 hypothetical protein H3V45_08480 [Gordonia rubripertincta]